MRAWTFYEKDIVMENNRGKDMMLAQLVREGLLTEEQGQKYSKEYGVILIQPSFFSRIWGKLFKDDEPRFSLVKMLDVDGWEANAKEISEKK